jgi:hypothetical protein
VELVALIQLTGGWTSRDRAMMMMSGRIGQDVFIDFAVEGWMVMIIDWLYSFPGPN